MRAYVIDAFGGPDGFHPMDLPTPAPPEGHVLLSVRATSVNPVDCKIRSGAVAAIAPAFPAILHMDVAGVVERVGAGAGRFREGDAVYGCAGGLKGIAGALADYMVADERLLAPKPPSLSFAEAAALPLVTITAWEALDRAGVREGRNTLIFGATGGVGHVAVQLARARGARVCATTAGARKVALARSLGADEVIDRADGGDGVYAQRLNRPEGFDVVIDTVGGAVLDQALAAAGLYGDVASIVTRSSHDLSPMHAKSLSLHVIFMLLPMLTGQGRERHGAILEQAAALVEEGRLRPLIDDRGFSFAQAGEAHALLESGQAVGKVSLVND